MILSRRHLLIVAGVVFVATLLANIPVSLLYAAFKPKASAVQLHGLSGAWTAGALSGVSQRERVILQDLHWSLRPWQLLLGRVGVQLRGGGQIATLEGGLSSGLGGTRLTDFRFAGGIRQLTAALGYSFVPLDGRAGGEIEKLILKNGQLNYAAAQVSLQQLQWTLAREPLLLGNFAAEISTAPEAITAVITSPEGPLETQGSAKLLPDGQYEIDLQVKPKPGASEMLINYVKTLGAPDAQGRYRLRQRGRMP